LNVFTLQSNAENIQAYAPKVFNNLSYQENSSHCLDVNIMYKDLKWQKMTKLLAYNDRFVFMQIFLYQAVKEVNLV
jgi:hypothetical protein